MRTTRRQRLRRVGTWQFARGPVDRIAVVAMRTAGAMMCRTRRAVAGRVGTTGSAHPTRGCWLLSVLSAAPVMRAQDVSHRKIAAALARRLAGGGR
jgi:hypothetical protein